MNLPPAPSDDELEDALRASRVLHDAPETLIQRAIEVFAPRASAAAAARAVPPRPGALRRLVATLGFDIAASGVLAVGLRGGGAMRQMLFSAGGRDIDLRVTRSADGRHWRVSGQVLGPDTDGHARLRLGDQVLDTAWNELAEFAFDELPAGQAMLTLQTADWEMDLPPLDLG